MNCLKILLPCLVISSLSGVYAQSNDRASTVYDPVIASIPADFSQFSFKGAEQEASWLNRYLWYFFTNRPNNDPVMFNKQFLTTSDMWLGGAKFPRRDNLPIQEVHRNDLMAAVFDIDGHCAGGLIGASSIAHPLGWPFPGFVQVNGGVPDTTQGWTVGWFFQDEGRPDEWHWPYFKLLTKDPVRYGLSALNGWETQNVQSLGIENKVWKLKATGVSPYITSPKDFIIDAFCAPYLQLRWKRTDQPMNHALPYVEWMRVGDKQFRADRRVYFSSDTALPPGYYDMNHSLVRMYDHPKWKGKVSRLRICLAPGESDVSFDIDSFFTQFDTRISTNNPIFVSSCWRYFCWTGNVGFLRTQIDLMRRALRYVQTVHGAAKYNFVRNTWPGHDGMAAFIVNKDGTRTYRNGHGMGDNYYDLLPFGGDDMYATTEYYSALQSMIAAEEAILAHPEWAIPKSSLTFYHKMLRTHAADVKKTVNKKFWDKSKGRFVGCIDAEGKAHDYGFIFVNLNAIYYGLATDEHARQIMDWIDGRRVVKGDTSVGADIYKFRFGPRLTTKRNLDWYGGGWRPEVFEWGYQVQDGGAVLGFSYYDMMSRLKVYGADDAWRRLKAILQWDREVWAAGGYRVFYKDGKQGNTLQGGGTAGGLGIDQEFYESSLVPSLVIYGFLGLNPDGAAIRINPHLPKACPEMEARNVLYHNMKLDVKASNDRITIRVQERPLVPITVMLNGNWQMDAGGRTGSEFEIREAGTVVFSRR